MRVQEGRSREVDVELNEKKKEGGQVSFARLLQPRNEIFDSSSRPE